MGDAIRRNTALLAQFVAREGHARVPAKHLEDGERLGGWVTSLRSKKIRLNAEQLSRLEELGFVWDVLTEQFEQNLAALRRYVSREGHARVPQGHIEDGVRLGSWVNAMRSKRQRLHPDRIARLNKLKFIWKATR